MRVLNILFDDRYGGMAARAIQVARALQPHGVETVLGLPEGNGNAADIARAGGIPVVRFTSSPIPSLQKPGRAFRWLARFPVDVFRLSGLLRNQRTDLVHVSGAFFVQPAMAAKWNRLPLVWHLNDTIVPRRLAPWFGAVVSRMADRILLEARAAGDHYRIDPSKVSVVHPPVDTTLFTPPTDDLAHDRSVARIGLIANWAPVKGIEYFLKAAALARSRLERPLEIVLAGAKLGTHDAYRREIEDLIRAHGLEACLHDYGFVTPVALVLSRLDVLASTSLTEACPLVILEAMASGVPVVATDVGGTSELLSADPERPAGVLVPSKDIESIAEAVLELLRHPETAKILGGNGRRVAEELFSVDRCAKRHLEAYRSLVRHPNEATRKEDHES